MTRDVLALTLLPALLSVKFAEELDGATLDRDACASCHGAGLRW